MRNTIYNVPTPYSQDFGDFSENFCQLYANKIMNFTVVLICEILLS